MELKDDLAAGEALGIAHEVFENAVQKLAVEDSCALRHGDAIGQLRGTAPAQHGQRIAQPLQKPRKAYLFEANLHLLDGSHLAHGFGVAPHAVGGGFQVGERPIELLIGQKARLAAFLQVLHIASHDGDGVAQIVGHGCLEGAALFQHVPQKAVVVDEGLTHALEGNAELAQLVGGSAPHPKVEILATDVGGRVGERADGRLQLLPVEPLPRQGDAEDGEEKRQPDHGHLRGAVGGFRLIREHREARVYAVDGVTRRLVGIAFRAVLDEAAERLRLSADLNSGGRFRDRAVGSSDLLGEPGLVGIWQDGFLQLAAAEDCQAAGQSNGEHGHRHGSGELAFEGLLLHAFHRYPIPQTVSMGSLPQASESFWRILRTCSLTTPASPCPSIPHTAA